MGGCHHLFGKLIERRKSILLVEPRAIPGTLAATLVYRKAALS